MEENKFLNEEEKKVVDNYIIKEALIRLVMTKRNGKEPTKSDVNTFTKYLNMEYENNTSKNSIDSRVNSICKAIETKLTKYDRIKQL